MINYGNSVIISPAGYWLLSACMYSAIPITVPYHYYCGEHLVTIFNKYTLPSTATSSISGSLPSSITIYQGTDNIGYRITDKKFDTVLTGITFENDPNTGLYLDGCYNLNNGTINLTASPHNGVTLENNCLQNTTGTFTLANVDVTTPIYFGENCCTNMNLVLHSNVYVSRVGANSFRNVTFGNQNKVGNIDPNCCVNMTQPMSFGNQCEVYSDLEPFILAHKDRCDELGIKALVFANNNKIVNATRIKRYYSNYITYSGYLDDLVL